MKMSRYIIILLSFITLCSCSISPWKREIYVNNEIPLTSEYSSLPDFNIYKKYFLNGAFIDVYMKATNATNYSSNSPYYLYVKAWGELEIGDIFIVDKMEITSSMGNEITYLDEFHFPIQVEFVKGSERYNRALINFNKKPFSIKFNKNEILTINLSVRVKRGDSEETKEIQYKLTPKVERGIFQISSV